MHDYRRQAVAAYLEAHFAEHKLGDRYDAHAKAQVFRLSTKGERYVLIVDETFLYGKTAGEISSALRTLDVADALHRFGTILLDEHGVHESRPKP